MEKVFNEAREAQTRKAMSAAHTEIGLLLADGKVFEVAKFIEWWFGNTAIFDDSFFCPTDEECREWAEANRTEIKMAYVPKCAFCNGGKIPNGEDCETCGGSGVQYQPAEPLPDYPESLVSFDWVRSIGGQKKTCSVDAAVTIQNGQPVVEILDVFDNVKSLGFEKFDEDELLAMRLRAVATYAGCGLKPSTNQPADYEI